MNVQQKIEKWCRNERFVRYANERISEELVYAPNHRIDPEYEELDEAVTWDNRYIVPMMTYLTYRLQLVKLQKNAKKSSADDAQQSDFILQMLDDHIPFFFLVRQSCVFVM